MSAAPNLEAFNAIVAYLREHGQATTSDIERSCGQCRRSALKRLQNLESRGVVRTKGVLFNKRATMGDMRVYELVAEVHEPYQKLPPKLKVPTTVPTAPNSLLDAWRHAS